MLQSSIARCFILFGIIVSVHGRVPIQAEYRPVFGNFNKQVEVFQGIFIDNCLINITATTYDGTVPNENINFQLKNDMSDFEININGCLKMKKALNIDTSICVIAKDERNSEFNNEITIDIKIKASEENINVDVTNKDKLQLSRSNIVAFVSENVEINTPVTKYISASKNSGPVEFKIVGNTTDDFSVDKFYDPDSTVAYFGRIIVNKKLNYLKENSFVEFNVIVSDNSSSDILNVRIYYKKANESGIVWDTLSTSYTMGKNFSKGSDECIATVHAFDNIITDEFYNPITYSIYEILYDRLSDSGSDSEELWISQIVKINQDNGCIQIEHENVYNQINFYRLMLVEARYRDDYSTTPVISSYRIKINLKNQENTTNYSLQVTNEMKNKY